jgi:type I restriction-modification system DNA methylase subunit
MANERINEDLIREKLKSLGYENKEKGFLMEEQISKNSAFKNLLRNAGKGGKGGKGSPEFILSSKKFPEFVIIIECKADTRFHKSDDLQKPVDYAVDGVIHYAKFLSKRFHVIAIGASGQSKQELQIDTFLVPKGEMQEQRLKDTKGNDLQEILEFSEMVRLAKRNPDVEKSRLSDLLKFSRELNNFLRDYAKLSEAEKPLLVSGLLLALHDPAFAAAWSVYDQEKDLPRETLNAIERLINGAELGNEERQKKEALLQAFKFIEYHPVLTKVNTKLENQSPLRQILNNLSTEVKPFLDDHDHYDIVGQFYGEFLRYTGGDKQGLGIVLTPNHITNLFAKLAKLTSKDVVLDTCTGTAGFLISSMNEMLKNSQESERQNILSNALIGVELQPNMFALAVSNMILRGDGKTNLFQGDSFDEDLKKQIKSKRPTKGMINPPYSQKGESLHEWDFIINMLDLLEPGGVGIAIVPMSLAIAPHAMKEVVLKNHRLEAVMSMPDDLFYPVGVVTCIMVFTAHTPHESDPHHESWFGYWKNDGFVKDKREGRIDKHGKWEEIREEWLSMYRKKEIPGMSVWQKVGTKDEWCAEAYLETDYNSLKEEDFEKELKKYFVFKTLNSDKS